MGLDTNATRATEEGAASSNGNAGKTVHTVHTAAGKKARERREGAAMLIVMMVLLAATATASFAVHSTIFELRSAGYARMAMQTSYVTDAAMNAGIAWAENIGPGSVQYQMQNSTPRMMPYERDLLTGQHGYRLYLTDFAAGATPIEMTGTPSLGPNMAYTPFFFVDFTDEVPRPCATAGTSVVNGFQCLYATVTARGRTRLRDTNSDGSPDDVRVGSEFRDYHEGASEMRAFVNLGQINN